MPKKILEILNKLRQTNDYENQGIFNDKELIDIVYEFYVLFKKRYEQIRENNFTIIPNIIKKEEIDKEPQEIFKKYFKFIKGKESI